MNKLYRLAWVGISSFAQWWARELGDVYTDIVRKVFPGWHRIAQIELTSDTVKIFANRLNSTPAFEYSRGVSKDSLPDTLPSDSLISLQGIRRAVLHVPSNYSFTQFVTLPMAVVPHLKQTIQLQLPRLMPLSPKSVVWTTDLISTDIDKKIVTARVSALKRSDIDSHLLQIGKWGFTVEAIHVASGTNEKPWISFSDLNSTQTATAHWSPIDRWLTRSAYALAALCFVVLLFQNVRAHRQLQIVKAETLQLSNAAGSRRSTLAAQIEPLAALSKQEQQSTIGQVLTDLNVTLPHDTWLTTLEVSAGAVRLVGITADSNSIVSHLNSSAVIHDVQLKSSMSAGIGTGRDRFEIRASLGQIK